MIGKIMKEHEAYSDHEVRIRLLEQLAERTFQQFDKLNDKMDSQFKWIIGTIIALFGGVILHSAKLI